MAVIKLRHLHNFFNHVPLAKGLQFRFIINFNQHTQTITNDATNITGEAVTKSQYGGVCPFIIASAKANNGGVGTIAAAGSIRADLSIGRTCLDNTLANYGGTTTSNLPQSVSLWVPSYVMNPSLEASYISANSSKRISYTDIYNFRITAIGANQTFNTLITSGIRGVRSVLVMPFFPQASNGSVQEFQSQPNLVVVVVQLLYWLKSLISTFKLEELIKSKRMVDMNLKFSITMYMVLIL
jgi:hypothetical protein